MMEGTLDHPGAFAQMDVLLFKTLLERDRP